MPGPAPGTPPFLCGREGLSHPVAPDSLTRPWRYRLASLFCGRGPFASYLDRNCWDAVCLNANESLTKVA